MKIGFDVSQTCTQRTGCAWYADRLIRSMVSLAPEHDYFLYHRFDKIHGGDPRNGTRISSEQVHLPYDDQSPSESAALWEGIRGGRPLEPSPDIVHCTSFQAPAIPGTKVVYTLFDISFWMVPEFTSEANRLHCQAGTLNAMRNASGLIFISKSGLEEFENLFPNWLSDTGMHHLVSPLGCTDLSPANGETEQGEQEAFWLAVNSLEPRKNLATLLEALEVYWGKSSSPKPLKLAGIGIHQDNATRRKVRELAKRGMVEDLGYVTDEQLSHLYSKATALLFPSWYEGFGLTILEAMTAGCPVVTSNRTSLPEVGGDAALYVDPQSPKSIIDAMLHIEEDPIHTEPLLLKGKKRAEEFTWEKTAQLTLDFYATVLSKA